MTLLTVFSPGCAGDQWPAPLPLGTDMEGGGPVAMQAEMPAAQQGGFASRSLAAIGPLSSLDRRLARRNLDLARGASLPDALPSDIMAAAAPASGGDGGRYHVGHGQPRGAAPPAPKPMDLARAASRLPELPEGLEQMELLSPGLADMLPDSLADAHWALTGGAPGGVGAGRRRGGGDAGMPDDPWEQLFGPTPRLLWASGRDGERGSYLVPSAGKTTSMAHTSTAM